MWFIIAGAVAAVAILGLTFETGKKYGASACEERHVAANELERARQLALAEKIIAKDAEIARLNAAIETANQEEIDATPPNLAACLDRAAAGRVRLRIR